jgi:LmbE family N-acetylglucosaminyl deacetylase
MAKAKPAIVLVVVAHTDDETIGCGGAIARHVDNGDKVFALSMTDGVFARAASTKRHKYLRAQASLEAGKVLGLKWLDGGFFPDNAMDTIPLLEVIKIIEAVKVGVNPTLVYTHSSADLNIDHRIVSQATLTAFRPQPNEAWEEIRTFEVASATHFGHNSTTGTFCPNLYIDVSNTWGRKVLALQKYGDEIREAPHARSLIGIENLAKYRGNQVGLECAEAFEIIRRVER